MFDLKSLLEPISEQQPAGPSLEYDADFMALERATYGKAEQEVGSTLIPAEPPQWDAVKIQALALLPRSKDLRIGTWLLNALLHTEGLQGLNAGLALLQALCEQYWPSLHPELDAEDDNDPTARINVLLALVDPQKLLAGLRDTPLAQSKVFGVFSLRDIRKTPDVTTLHAAFADTPLSDLQDNTSAATKAIAHLKMMEDFITQQVGTEAAPSFKALIALLQDIESVLSTQLGKQGVKENTTTQTSETPPPTAENPSSAQTENTGVMAPSDIRSREDVFRGLDLIIDYYKNNEPSSPMPLLLKRAQHLIYKDFMEIIEDLVPAGVTQAKAICSPSKK